MPGAGLPADDTLYSAATGGTAVWSESQKTSTVKGLFSVSLGSTTPIPDSLFDGRPLWLGVALDGGSEASPRLPLGAVPFALGAKTASTAQHALVTDSAGKVAGLLDSLKSLRALLRDLANRDSARHAQDSVRLRQDSLQLAEFAVLLKGMKRSGADLFFDSMNVVVRNGLGRTDSANGLGNLIVGYNESRGQNADSRSGSHMLITGMNNDYTSFGGIVAGTMNGSTGHFASVLGGGGNNATGDFSVVLGGIANTASGFFSTVAGGAENTASGDLASVTGGEGNTASGTGSSVSGGGSNVAAGTNSTVGGGGGNTAKGDTATAVGGNGNNANGTFSGIFGGSGQTVDADTGTSP